MMENVDNKIDRILIKETAAMAQPRARMDNYQRRQQPMAQVASPLRTTPVPVVAAAGRQLTAQDCSYYETYDMRLRSKLTLKHFKLDIHQFGEKRRLSTRWITKSDDETRHWYAGERVLSL